MTDETPQAHQTKARTKVFISHASEDKERFVRSLAETLRTTGIDVWFDQFSMVVGDSLMSAIDRGLSECDHGIVVLSPAFFAKQWTVRELRGLVAREMASGSGVILPVWLDVGRDDIVAFSPPLADTVAVTATDRPVWEVARDLLAAIDPVARFSLRATQALAAQRDERPELTEVALSEIIALPPRPLRMPGHLAVRATLCEMSFPMFGTPDLAHQFEGLSRDTAPEQEVMVHEILAAAYWSVLAEVEVDEEERAGLRRFLIATSLGVDLDEPLPPAEIAAAALRHYERLAGQSREIDLLVVPDDVPEGMTVEDGQRLVAPFVAPEEELVDDLARLDVLMARKEYGAAARLVDGVLMDRPQLPATASFRLRARRAYAIGMTGAEDEAITGLLALQPEAVELFGSLSEESFNVRANHADFVGRSGDALRAARLYAGIADDVVSLAESAREPRLTNMRNGARHYVVAWLAGLDRDHAPSEQVEEALRILVSTGDDPDTELGVDVSGGSPAPA